MDGFVSPAELLRYHNQVNTAYHSLMAGIESMHSSCGDSVSPTYTPTESHTPRSSSPDPTPQPTQSSRRPTLSSLWKSEHTAPNTSPFSSSAASSGTAEPSQPRSPDSKTSYHTSHDHHSSPKPHSTKPSSAGSNGSNGSSRTSQIPTSKLYDNLRDPRSSSPGQGSHSSAGRFHVAVPSHSKSRDYLRDHPRSLHESGQVPPSTAYGPRPEASNRSKNNHITQEAGPTYNSPKGGLRGSRDAKRWQSRTDKYSQPVIPPTASKLHKRSTLGLGE